MNNLKLQLPEVVVPGQRLGRSISHDPRSLQYLVQPTGVAQTKIWDRKTPILDQGNLGSCTGNATVGVLGSEPYYDTLPTGADLTETEAVKVYSLATQLDDFAGTYPPTDSGSSGLGAAKAATKLGFISGYQHITSIAAAQTAILSGPFIVGTNWLSGMDNPAASGLVKVSGTVRGGHEYECFGFDASADMWHFCNSWGTGWGDAGRFMYSTADFAKLLAAQGDATTFVPVNQPAPTPTPTPVPPAPQPTDPAFVAWMRDVDATYEQWRAHPIKDRRQLEAVIEAWKMGVQ